MCVCVNVLGRFQRDWVSTELLVHEREKFRRRRSAFLLDSLHRLLPFRFVLKTKFGWLNKCRLRCTINIASSKYFVVSAISVRRCYVCAPRNNVTLIKNGVMLAQKCRRYARLLRITRSEKFASSAPSRRLESAISTEITAIARDSTTSAGSRSSNACTK